MIEPNFLLVHPRLYPIARKLLGARIVKSVGNYSQKTFEGETWWERANPSPTPRRGVSLRADGYYELFYRSNRGMRKHGMKELLSEQEYRQLFAKQEYGKGV